MFGDRTSKVALLILDDGDDLHITDSFCAIEENSSTVGNSSVMPAPFPPSPSSTKASDDDSTSGADPAEMKPIRKAILGKIPSLARNLRSNHKLWSRKLSLVLARQRQQRGIQEYQEFNESDSVTEANTSFDDISVNSIRSARVNVATGRSFLVRQNAQVVGRPSMAYTDWDARSESSRDSGSVRSSRSKRSLSWDNASKGSLSDVSHLTELSFRSKQSSFSMSRAMYISSGHSLLGDALSEVSENEQDENDISNSTFFADLGVDDSFAFNKSIGLETVREEENLFGDGAFFTGEAMPSDKRNSDKSTSRNGQKFPDTWETFSTSSCEGWSGFNGSNRQRFFSESDIVFEFQRERRKEMDACESQREKWTGVAAGTNTAASDRNILWDFDTDDEISENRARTYSDSVVKLNMNSLTTEGLSQTEDLLQQKSSLSSSPPRRRLKSDSHLFDSFSNPSTELGTDDDIIFGGRPRVLSDGDLSTSSSGAPLLWQHSPRTRRARDIRQLLASLSFKLDKVKESPIRRASTDGFYPDSSFVDTATTTAATTTTTANDCTDTNEPTWVGRGRLHSDSDIALRRYRRRTFEPAPMWRLESSPSSFSNPPRTQQQEQQQETLSDQSDGNPFRVSFSRHTMSPSQPLSSPECTNAPNYQRNDSSSLSSSSSLPENNNNNNPDRKPFQPLARLSSPDAASAARMIATNLRPACAPLLPTRMTTTTTTTTPRLHDYYWNNEGSESDSNSPFADEVLWSFSSDSFDDIL